MKQLSYKTLEETGYSGYLLKNAPERIIQFGEGNFLRAFADYFIDVLNEKTGFNSKVVLVQPVGKHNNTAPYKEQDGLYTLYLRGFEKGQKVNDKRVISCVSRCLNPYDDYEEILACAENPEMRYIICNTTEAGIVYDDSCKFEDAPPSAYPAKLTQFLYRRFESLGENARGFVVLPCELIDDNGKALRECVLKYACQWELGDSFIKWLNEENIFCSTLVDRIVTGFPKGEQESLNAENGYEDKLIDTAEVFAFWAVEAPKTLKEELPFEKAGLPVVITGSCKPYKERKVRILNGAHTSMVLGAYLAGKNIVRECMEDDVIYSFMKKAVYDEIIPTLTLPENELREFADSVVERFKNPFIDHELLSISLNSTSKWRARVLPAMLDYIKIKGEIPKCLAASLAFYILFYNGCEICGDGLSAEYNGRKYTVKDDVSVIEFFYAHRNDNIDKLVYSVMSNADFWGCSLAEIAGLREIVTKYLKDIKSLGIYEFIKQLI